MYSTTTGWLEEVWAYKDPNAEGEPSTGNGDIRTALYEYYDDGRQKFVTNARGYKTEYIYDGKGRLEQVKYWKETDAEHL